MSNKTPISPDILQIKKKKIHPYGYRPLITIFITICIVAITVGYTFYKRMENTKNASGSKADIIVRTSTNIPNFLKNNKKNTRESDNSEGIPQESQANNDDNRNNNNEDFQMPHSQEYEARLRLIQRIEEKRLETLEAALIAPTKTFSRNEQNHSENKSVGTDDSLSVLQTAANNASKNMYGYNGNLQKTPQQQKNAFLAEHQQIEIYLNQQRALALLPKQEIKAGTVIPGIMISGLNSDLPGQAIAQIREDVYDTVSGHNLLIPAAARLVGIYDSNISYGQKRILIGWQRIIFPDGSSLSLEKMPGSDPSGYAGFYDQVNNHYWRIFGNGLLLSFFSAAIQLSQPQAGNGENYTTSQSIASSLGQQMGNLGIQMAQKNMNISPTLEIRPGYIFNITVTKDIILPVWK